MSIYTKIYDILPKLLSKRSKISPKSTTFIYDDEIWFDDYFTLKYIDETTIAIGEPRYWQRNYSYLIIGDTQALLFDSGIGIQDISAVVQALTDLPIIHMISHYHYDHIGNIDKFKTIYLSQNQLLLQQNVLDNTIYPSLKSTLRILEGQPSKQIKFSKVLENTQFINLGNRQLQSLYSPGHHSESISLYDPQRRQLFVGDFLMKGTLYIKFLPLSDYSEFKWATFNLLNNTQSGTTIYTAHPFELAHELNNPYYTGGITFADHLELSYKDLIDINMFINQHPSSNSMPKKMVINDHLNIVF